MKTISILGSTGSIGTQTLEIVRNNPDIKVAAISGNNNTELLKKQILEFSPKLVCVYNEKNAEALKNDADIKCDIVTGMDGLIDVATFDESEMVVTAIVGMIGIRPTVEAIKAGKDIALANKETLVCAGSIIMPLAKEKGINIYPVDSEHSAIFQCLNGEPKSRAVKILLTASGGPFRGKTRDELQGVCVKDALNHPNWSMGKKVTIDSSTLANKGLEVMEAKWLFDMEPDDIQVVVHAESIIHSMVEFEDGAVMAQLGVPDMKLPIQYALFYPDRRPMADNKLDFYTLKNLTFEEPDMKTFKALALAFKAIKTGGIMPTVFNAANEKAVKLFLNEEINFLEIADMIEHEMDNTEFIQNPSLDEIIAIGDKIIS